MFAGCLQIMSAHLQLIRVEALRYWQLIRVENTDICRSCDLCLQVVTDTDAQIAALKSSGCELIFQEKASGGRWNRPELHRLLGQLRKGDVLVVWKLDRLSRSLKDVLLLMEKVEQAGASFCSLTEVIDTTSPAGRMMMQMVATFAEFERAMLRERTQNGLDAARKQGRVGGRRPKLKKHQQEEIVNLVNSGQKNAADAARLFNVHPATVSRILQRDKTP
jgi:DNA invertase Pin-like site-specific DNA recombinase